MPDEIRSPTQRELSITDIAAIVRDAIGAEVDRGEELTGGGFATVWWAVLADGRQVAVKVGPAAGARLLAYEKGLLIAEAEYFRLVGDRAPVPTVLFESDDVLISTMLPGRALTEIPAEQAAPIRTELGRAVARIHEVTGTRFGYTGGRVSEATWPDTFVAMVDEMRRDAAAWNVPLPRFTVPTTALAEVTTPHLVHFDLWDGNVLASRGRLTGLVDGERYLWGDPLVDLVSPALRRRIEETPDHPFLVGHPVEWTDAVRERVSLYRIHLYLLMITEGPSRGIPLGGERHGQLSALLDDELAYAGIKPLAS